MSPGMDPTLEMYGNSPNSSLAMSMDKSTADALSGGRSSKYGSNGNVNIHLGGPSGLSKMMSKGSKAPKGGMAGVGNNKSSSSTKSIPMSIPRRAVEPVEIGPDGKPIKRMVGDYSPESRRARIARFMAKRHKRIWTKRVKYDVRKNFADSRLRVKGRFVKKEDEELLRELLNMT